MFLSTPEVPLHIWSFAVCVNNARNCLRPTKINDVHGFPMLAPCPGACHASNKKATFKATNLTNKTCQHHEVSHFWVASSVSAAEASQKTPKNFGIGGIGG